MFIAAVLGVVTGTFGGVIGDVVCNRVPNLFRTAPLYATCSFVGCWVMFVLNVVSVPQQYSVSLSIAVIVLLRLAALRWNWRLPQAGGTDEDHDGSRHDGGSNEAG